MRIILFIILLITSNVAVAGSRSTFPNGEQLYEKANPKMIWGRPTNILTADLSGKPFQAELKAGINVSNGVIILSRNPLMVVHPIEIGFANDSTNSINVILPKLNKWLILSMVGTNGALVSKTRQGLAVGRVPKSTTNVTWRHWGKYGYAASVFSHSVNMYEFDPTKYFVINTPGYYKLTVIQHLYVVDTNICLKVITLPPVTVPVRVEK